VGEDAGRVEALARVVEDVELDGHTVANPAGIVWEVGLVRTVAEPAAGRPQRRRAVPLDGEGEPVGPGVRAPVNAEGELGSEIRDPYPVVGENTARLIGHPLRESGDSLGEPGAA